MNYIFEYYSHNLKYLNQEEELMVGIEREIHFSQNLHCCLHSKLKLFLMDWIQMFICI